MVTVLRLGRTTIIPRLHRRVAHCAFSQRLLLSVTMVWQVRQSSFSVAFMEFKLEVFKVSRRYFERTRMKCLACGSLR